MHIHLPKPLHGWKEFANEIFVIVIGVLIALGFEALVEEVHCMHKAEDGRERLRAEIATNFRFSAELAMVTPCVLAQLDALQAHLAAPDAARQPMPLDRFPDNLAVLRLPTRPWATATWEALQQDGTSSHLSVEEQRYLGSLYSEVETLRSQTASPGDAAGKLLVTGYSGELSAQTRSDLRVVVTEQYRRSQYMGRLAAQVMATARDLGFKPEDDAHMLDSINRSTASNTIGFCKARGLPLNDWKREMDKWPSVRMRAI